MLIHRNDRTKIFEDIETELARTKVLHQEKFNSIPEMLGVIREEYLEVEHLVMATKKNVPPPEELTELHKELVQLGAVCAKAIESFCIVGIQEGGLPDCYGACGMYYKCRKCSFFNRCDVETNKDKEEG